ncbi:MAG: hydroxyphenylacetyl-CoA thioesterase PaaI [Candidatus Competibacteraceae bacterium]|nr:hydroxyphenylacetyl-CoA thioesterase PaaI [Candidatus Competibacteraceae bacterium]
MLDPFMNLLGLQGEITAPGQARVWGTIRPEFLNSWGSAHGGFLYSVADAAFALASNSRGTLAVALSAHIEYVQASEAGATVEARAIEAHAGRRTAVYRIEIHSGEKLLALFTGTVYRRRGQPASLGASD